MPEDQTSRRAAESITNWNNLASCWDAGIGADGNKYWRLLQRPCLERLIDVKPGCLALDLATGNGLTARWLAGRGATVIGTDGSEKMLETAIARTAEDERRERITFRKLDVTVEGEFDELLADMPQAKDGFDVVLINMALMDIPTIEPLAASLHKLLKKDGVFVATQLHPVFFTPRTERHLELDEEGRSDKPGILRAMVLKQYMLVSPWKGVAIPGQMGHHWYFHRTFEQLFGTFFAKGLAMDGMEELAFDEDAQEVGRIEARCNFTQFPVILAFRMRRLK